MHNLCVWLISITMLGIVGTTAAADNLVGTYEGTVGKVQKLPMKEGDACTTTVTYIEKLHAYKFSINEIEPVLVKETKIDKGMQSGNEVKISNSIQGKGVEAVLFKHKDGVLIQLNILHRRMGAEGYVICGSLARKSGHYFTQKVTDLIIG